MFNHVECDLPALSRKTIDGVRYYSVDDRPMVSITSVTSYWNREIFKKWRARIGEEEANRITKKATNRGTKTHELIEHYLLNEEVVLDNPSTKMLFTQAKKELRNIDNIYALEKSLYSRELGVAGTVDCIAEYKGELAIIDFKTSTKEKREEWIHDYFAQETAYAIMFQELTGLQVKKLVTIIACETGSPQVFEIYDKFKYARKLKEYIDTYRKAYGEW